MTRVQRFRINSPRVINQVLDGEAVIIHLDTGYYYSLDDLGAEVWESLANGRSIPQILDDVSRRYRGSRQEIETVVGRLVASLVEEDLISADNDGPAAAPEKEAEEAAPGVGDRLPLKAPMLHKYTDMQDLLLLDPIHEVEETGWPERKAAEG